MVDKKEETHSLDNLRTLRGYKDEIPAEIIHSDSPDNRYKVRKGWFIAVAWTIEALVDQQKIQDPKLMRLHEGYVN